MNFLKRFLLKRRNKKVARNAYLEEFERVLKEVYDPAEAESVMWCRKHGWSDDGSQFSKRKLKLKLVKG